MKNIIKLFFAFIAFSMFFFLSGCGKTITVDGIKYYLSKEYIDGELCESYKVVGLKDSKILNVVIPKYINNIEVTSIGRRAFCDENILSVVLPNSIKLIDDCSFMNCLSLSSINFPDGLETIEWSAFKGCTSLTKVDLPNSVISVQNNAFEDCTSLKYLKLPNNKECSFSKYALTNCTGLEELEICFYIFDDYEDNVDVICDDYNYVSISTLELPVKKVIISSGCKIIPNWAFWGWTKLQTVVIPNTVNEIGSMAFYLCSSLNNINLPSSVKRIGANAFKFCRNLKKISMDGVTDIMDEAFFGCKNLEKVDLSSNLKTIGNQAFWSCINLKEIILPEKITKIGANCFEALYLSRVYFMGSIGEWETIDIDSDNLAFDHGGLYFYSYLRPTNNIFLYWHFVDGKPKTWVES